MVALCKQMQTDGLVPIAFGDKDGWPAMGTFDMLNMRVNGFDYHISLMAGEEDWNSQEVKAVFDQWRELLPYHQTDALGRTWQEAAQTLQQKKAGMYILGTFLNEQFPDDEEDLDFFTFPEIDSNIGSGAIDAPIDGFCMSADPDNEEGAKAFLAYLASPGGRGRGRRPRACPSSRPTRTPTPASTPSCRRSRPSWSARPTTSPSSSTATRARTSRRPSIIPSLQQFLGSPDDVDGLTEEHPGPEGVDLRQLTRPPRSIPKE